jgi:hypothetical protein
MGTRAHLTVPVLVANGNVDLGKPVGREFSNLDRLLLTSFILHKLTLELGFVGSE